MEYQKTKHSSSNVSDTILEHLLDAVLIVDEKGTIVYVNKAAGALFCKPVNALLGQCFGFPITPGEVDEIQLLSKGTLLTVQVLATHIRWNDHHAYLLSLRDITALKSTAEELSQQKTRLEESNEELELYASLASHDLKEPIRKVLIYSDRLLHHTLADTDTAAKELVEKIQRAAHRMGTLISGIAAFSRLACEEAAFVPTDLNRIIRDVCTDLELLMSEKGARVQIDPLPTIEAIPVQIHQLFLNLIANALKYSKKEVAPLIRVGLESDGEEQVRISFTDNGIGFDGRFAEKIFQPFTRLHGRQYDGTGIGLTICKKIAESHGGTITVSSQPGVGSTFLLTLQKNHTNDRR